MGKKNLIEVYDTIEEIQKSIQVINENKDNMLLSESVLQELNECERLLSEEYLKYINLLREYILYYFPEAYYSRFDSSTCKLYVDKYIQLYT